MWKFLVILIAGIFPVYDFDDLVLPRGKVLVDRTQECNRNVVGGKFAMGLPTFNVPQDKFQRRIVQLHACVLSTQNITVATPNYQNRYRDKSLVYFYSCHGGGGGGDTVS